MSTEVIKLGQRNYRLICRICYQQNDLKDIFKSKYQDITFAAILELFVPLKISESDGLPTLACIKCIKSVLNLNAFLDQYRVATEALKSVQSYLYNTDSLNNKKNSKRCIQINYTKIPDEKCLLEKCSFVNSADNIDTDHLNPHIKTTKAAHYPQSRLEAKIVKCPDCKDPSNNHLAFISHRKPEQICICAICNKEFNMKSKLIKHLDISHSSTGCNVCGLKMSRSSLNNHLKRHRLDYVPIKKLPRESLCTICGATIRYNMKAHMLAHKNPKPFHCKICPFKTAFWSSVIRHQIKHKGRPLLCNICGKDFSRKDYFRKHMKLHEVSETSQSCNICSENFDTQFEYRKHLNSHDSAARNMFKARKKVLRTPRKNICANGYVGNDPPKSAKKCEECGEICMNHLAYIDHMKFKHQVDKRLCSICGEKVRGHMSVHMKIHIGQPIHKCGFCNKVFNSRAHLNRHKLIHENKRENMCFYCGKGFNLANSLKEHIRTHTGETLKCGYCDKTFKQTSMRYKHFREVHNVRLGKPKKTIFVNKERSMDNMKEYI